MYSVSKINTKVILKLTELKTVFQGSYQQDVKIKQD